MSDVHPEGHEPQTPAAIAPAEEPTAEPISAPAPEPVAAPLSPERKLAIGLACMLAVLVILVGTAPFWGPSLPWGAAHDDAELNQRLDRLETAQRQSGGAQQRLERLEAAQKETQGVGPRLGAIESGQKDLDKKLAQLAEQAQAGVAVAVQPLDRRIAALEGKPTVAPDDVAALRQQFDKLSATTGDLAGRLAALEGKPTVAPDDVAELRRQLEKMSGTAADLAARIDTIDKNVRTSIANDLGDMAVALTLLQIREAVDVGRPFASEYDLLAGFARNRRDIAPAAAALAGPAKTGIATRAVLIARLRSLADTVASTPAPAKDESWTGAALDRVRGLVTIRRVDPDGSPVPENGSDAMLHNAETALAGGDLDKAIASVATLSGSAGDRAMPWLRMARERFAVEIALHQAEVALLARFGRAANPAAAPAGPPG